MYWHDGGGGYLVTDTLATNPDGTPRSLVAKWSYLPHLDMVIAFTGIGDLGSAWAHRVQVGLLAVDIEMLDIHTPAALKDLSAELEERLGPLPEMTSTVYHFGPAESDGAVRGYAYRSEHDFASERLPLEMFGVKPHPVGDYKAPEDVDGIIDLAVQIRDEQDQVSMEDRIHIGGYLTMVSFGPDGAQAARIHRFDDFDADWIAMNDLL